MAACGYYNCIYISGMQPHQIRPTTSKRKTPKHDIWNCMPCILLIYLLSSCFVNLLYVVHIYLQLQVWTCLHWAQLTTQYNAICLLFIVINDNSILHWSGARPGCVAPTLKGCAPLIYTKETVHRWFHSSSSDSCLSHSGLQLLHTITPRHSI